MLDRMCTSVIALYHVCNHLANHANSYLIILRVITAPVIPVHHDRDVL